jgi:hypothetical protein
MTLCRLCRRPAMTAQLNFGEQALTNRFLHSADESEPIH